MTPERKLERVKGLATLATVRRGTGSEHTGVMLDTSEGERLILVRLGANPFEDLETRELVGSTLEVEGYRVGNELRYVSTRKVG
jgi:hypothetical protein